jgi:Casein kinase II regulatory subunit
VAVDLSCESSAIKTMSHNGSSETSSFIDECWASWFCNLSGNHFFCEIDKAYMEDSFNLFGLKQHVLKDYSKALDTILDRLGTKICRSIGQQRLLVSELSRLEESF